MISDCLGVYEKDSIVQYIANGLPIYSHDVEDLQSFRFITSNFIKEACVKLPRYRVALAFQQTQ